MAAIVTITNAMAPTYHYVFKDHLGSILRVTNAAGTPEADQSFDAWGRRRNPTTWAYTSATAPTQTWLYRGYTAHEHLDQFALINMNGRLYDPTVGRMLSPDNYVQDALYAQTFNRYSYAHNNPLKFTDPDGENPAVVVGAVLGGLINLGVGIWRGEVHDLWDGIVYFGTGAAIGALAGATGGTSLAGGATSVLGGIYSGAITGAATGAWSGMLQGIANATWQTIRYHAPASNIAKAGGEGLVAGAISGAIIGGTVGGIKAALKGLPFSPKTAPKVTPTPAGTTPTVEPQTLSNEWDEGSRSYKYGGKPTVNNITTHRKLDVYRSVSLEEYQDIVENGFRPNKFGYTDGKLFTYNHNDAEHFSKLFDNTIIVKARIPAGIRIEQIMGTDGLLYMYNVPTESLSKIKLVTYFVNP